jgi:hypothetical protein
LSLTSYIRMILMERNGKENDKKWVFRKVKRIQWF